MFTMIVIGAGQIILAIISIQNCKSSSNPFQFICGLQSNNSELQFWIPSATILIGAILSFIFGCMLRKMITEAEEDANYY